MTELFTIPLMDGGEAIAAYVQTMNDLPRVFAQLGLQKPRPVLALVGGAGQMIVQDDNQLKQFFTTVIAETAMKLRATIVDGGTNSGVMQLIGQARAGLNANFPLVGVAPFLKISLPHLCHLPPASAQPAPQHTHFILVPGNQWGDESAWLAQVTTLLAGQCPSVTIVVNGGEITWNDVVESVAARRLTLVLAGSGRMADRLANAFQSKSEDSAANHLVSTGLLKLIRLESDLSQLAQELAQILAVS